jgi:hypothetical protein
MFLLMKKLGALFILALLVACVPTPTAVPLTSPTPVEVPATNTAAAVPEASSPTATISQDQTSLPETSGLWLQIISPLDEAVVDTPQVDVLGSAPAGAVVSVNDEILIVGSDSQFKVTVLLEDGPNLIEIIASDDAGNELSTLLTVTYEP